MDWRSHVARINVPANSELGKLFAKKVQEATECTMHELNYNVFSNRYRKYRRGRNRCPRCGVRLK